MSEERERYRMTVRRMTRDLSSLPSTSVLTYIIDLKHENAESATRLITRCRLTESLFRPVGPRDVDVLTPPSRDDDRNIEAENER